MGARLRLALGSVLVVFLGASAAYSANVGGLRDRYPPPATGVEGAAAAAGGEVVAEGAGTGRRSSPWWQEVERFSGSGDTKTDEFTISERSLQWRVVWECTGDPFSVRAVDAGGADLGNSLAEADDCPTRGTGFSVRPGEIALEIAAGGPWEITVEQQLNLPLHEPPSEEMEDGEVVATGTFYDMERSGEGALLVYRLPNGDYALRLEDFYVTPNVDLEIDVSNLLEPTSAKEFLGEKRERVAMLPVTTGDMNFAVPPGIDLRTWRSIVIYCEPLRIAYTGVTLEWNDT